MSSSKLSQLFNVAALEEELNAAFSPSSSYSLLAQEVDGATQLKQPAVNYGTAGFRGLSSLLPPLAYRVMFVLLARGMCLRSAAATSSSSAHHDVGINPLSVGNLGLCITASHNPSKDNGFKMVDGDGGMLNVSWEGPATKVANEANVESFLALLEGLVEKSVVGSVSVADAFTSGPVVVQVARDTRPSGIDITKAVEAAVVVINKCSMSVDGAPLIRVVDHGVMTTPALHNLVFWHRWTGGSNPHFNAVAEKCFSAVDRAALTSATFTSGQGLSIYSSSLSTSFAELTDILPKTVVSPASTAPPATASIKKHVVVDCSNGVGASVMKTLLKSDNYISGGGGGSSLCSQFHWHLLKDDVADASMLNEKCGADYVQKTQVPISDFHDSLVQIVTSELNDATSPSSTVFSGVRQLLSTSTTTSQEFQAELEAALSGLISFYAFDGDADRIVAFAPVFNPTVFSDLFSKVVSTSGTDLVGVLTALLSVEAGALYFSLIDGNRLSVLFACLVGELGVTAAIKGATAPLVVGTVQTAYTNGASSLYAEKVLNLTVKSAATGVKHLHPVAEQMGVGLYFEANGHGTMLLSTELLDNIATITASSSSSSTSLVIALQWIRMLLSQSCGDAIAGLLASELTYYALSHSKGCIWSARTLLALYKDMPSITDKVVVPDPSIIKNTADERRVTSPSILQDKIDAIVSTMKEEDPQRAPSYRSFVRPSGTEPIVRIYSEAPTVDLNKRLYGLVAEAVLLVCGGGKL